MQINLCHTHTAEVHLYRSYFLQNPYFSYLCQNIKSFDKQNSMLIKNSLTIGLKLTTTNSVHLSRDMAFLMFCFHRRPKANQSA